MKKILKIVLWIILVSAILLGIAAFALVKFVDPNDFKPQIISAVNAATGRQLSLPGKLSWSFYPEVGIHLGAASLSNPPGFNQKIFAEIDSGGLAVSFWGLLQGKIQFDTLDLNGLKVYLIQQTSNRNNWTFTSNTSTTPSNNHPQEKSTVSSSAVSIESINITNGTISYDNDQTRSHYALDAINLNANNVGLNHTFPISFSANYNINQDITGNFKINTQVNFNQESQVLLLKNLGIETLTNYPTTTDSIKLSTNISGNVTTNLKNETISAPSLDFVINQVLKGTINDLQVTGFSTPKFSGNLQTSNFSLKDLLSSFGMNDIAVENKSLLNKTAIQTQFTGSLNSLNLNNFVFNMGNSQLNANLNISSFSPLNLTENVQLNQLDLADFVNLKGARLPMQGITSSGSINSPAGTYPHNLNGDINLNVQSLILKGFDLSALIDSLGKTVDSLLKNVTQVATASTQLQQQMQGVMGSQGINPNNGQHTDLGSLTAKINIRQGVITTPTLSLQGPVVLVNGSGNIDLNARNINYELDARVAHGTNKFLQGLTIPYDISGKFGNVSQGINWIVLQAEILKYLLSQIQQTIQNTVKATVQQSIQQLQNGGQGAADLGNDIGNKAAKALNSIFGGQ